ncbi:MAG: hypothetical protein EB060_05280 [Proteobacteria bacterium]|nr:hypothetical protein [Pseudomonadota bacterium]
MIALSFWAARRTGIAEGALLIGTTTLYFYGNLPREFYIVLTLLPATIARLSARPLRRRLLLTVFTVFWISGVLVQNISNNLLFNDYFISGGMLVLLVFWLVSAATTRASLPVPEPVGEKEEASEPEAEEKPRKSFLKRKPKEAKA